MSNTIQQLHALREKIQSVPQDVIRLYATCIELSHTIEKKRSAVVISVSQMAARARGHLSEVTFSPELDSAGAGYIAAKDSQLEEYSRLLGLRDAFSNSNEVQAAVALVGPLHEQLMQLEKLAEVERIGRQEAEAKLADALREAQIKALQKAGEDAEVKKARAALEQEFPDSVTTRKSTKRALGEISESFAPSAPPAESPVS